MKTYPTRSNATGMRFAVVVSRFNQPVPQRLLEGCIRVLEKRGAAQEDVHVAWVPGAFEIPLASRALAATGRYHALVALGAVIRGETSHFDYVCRCVSDGLREVMRDTGVPVAFGVLTTDDAEQALARSGGSAGHKGEEVAAVAIEMAHLAPELSRIPEDEA